MRESRTEMEEVRNSIFKNIEHRTRRSRGRQGMSNDEVMFQSGI